MTRDKALAIADRIMARVEIDRAIHRDAIADEVIAAMALQKERALNRQLAPQVKNYVIGVPGPLVAGPGIPAIGFKSHGVEGANNVAIRPGTSDKPAPPAREFVTTVMCDQGWFRSHGGKWIKILG